MFFFAMVIVIGLFIVQQWNTSVQSNPIMPVESKSFSADVAGRATGLLDNAFLMVAFGSAIVIIVLASLVRIHPIFIPLYLIALIAYVVISAVLSNAYQDMMADSHFAGVAATLTYTNYIMSYLPWFVAIIGTILAVVMYKTWANPTGVA